MELVARDNHRTVLVVDDDPEVLGSLLMLLGTYE